MNSKKRVSYGQFVAGDEGRACLQGMFLSRVTKSPGVIESLKAGMSLPLSNGSLYDGANSPVREFLVEWSKSWHLNAEWVHEGAFRLLCYWSVPRELLIDANFALLERCLRPLEGLPPYDPTKETRDDYLGTVAMLATWRLKDDATLNRGDTKAFVESIVDSARPQCEEAERGLPLAGSYPKLERDIDWTVRFQVQEQEPRQIAIEDEVSQDQVEKAIKRMLEGLALARRNRPGRQRGSKNSPR